MAKGCFTDKAQQPDPNMLLVALGNTMPLWQELAGHIESVATGAFEWKYYGSAFGWSYLYKAARKNLLYMTPNEGVFLVSFSFSEKGRELSRKAGFPDEVVALIEAGKDNPAGRTFDIPVKTTEDAELVKQLLNIKQKS